MEDRDFIDELRNVLANHPPGPIPESTEVLKLLRIVWDDLAVTDHGGMSATKLVRMEDLNWTPPTLTFIVERHGTMVFGSSRAKLQKWAIDLDKGTKEFWTSGCRQVEPMKPKLDVNPIAKELAEAIIAEKSDERLKRDVQGRVHVLIGKIIPAKSAVKATLEGRRKRLRMAVEELLAPVGWHKVRANVFAKSEIR